MTVVIRMKRTGRKNRPCYRISVADKQAPRDGRTIETLGQYDPASPIPELRLTLNVERAKYWISTGAQPSDTVRSIFKRGGVFGEYVPPKKRDRSARKKVTSTRKHREELEKVRAERKEVRHRERVKARAKLAKAKAASEGAKA